MKKWARWMPTADTGAPPVADVCMVIEGAYPYVSGGVSSWVHDLISAQSDLSFHLAVLKADDRPRPLRFTLPANVVGMTEIALQQMPTGVPVGQRAQPMMKHLEPLLSALLQGGGAREFQQLLDTLKAHPATANTAQLLNSEAAFQTLQRMYRQSVPDTSFLQYFWSWRSLVGGMLSVLLAPLPKARVYHAVSTGYAGLFMARAANDAGRPALLTEHGIYTNERRIELAMAEWLNDHRKPSLQLEKGVRGLSDVWLDAFVSYSRICYRFCSQIITLYGGNQPMQLRDGAIAERMTLIPNGVDIDMYGAVKPASQSRLPTIALIGRVVQIKDIKTYIRAVALLRTKVPAVRALLIGPTEEEPVYYRECLSMVEHLGLHDCFEFTGRVRLADYLGQVDVAVLTSVSEAQQLVLLEAGAAGVPCVATDVGACREIVEGRLDETPHLGLGGRVTPLANPQATAQALAELLLDPALRARCSAAIQARTVRYYSNRTVYAAYEALYRKHMAEPDGTPAAKGLY